MRTFPLGSIVFAVFLGVVGLSPNATAQQISFSPSPVSFGSIPAGSTKTQTVTISNVAGRDVNLTQATLSGTGFAVTGISCPVIIPSGQSTTFNVTFSPSAAGNYSGTVSITSQFWNSNKNHKAGGSVTTTTLSLSGSAVTAGQLGVSPATYHFGSVNAGASSSMSAMLTATGAAVTISSLSSTDSDFAVSGLSLPVTLAAGQSVNFSTKFAPLTAGSFSGNISFQSNAANSSISMAVSGTGAAAQPGSLSSNPASLAFGSVQNGTTKSLSETVTNTGSSSVTISQANVTGAGLSTSGLTQPMTLTASQSVTFNVVYAPAAAGAVSGNLALVSNASNTTLNVPLSGTGTANGQLSVTPGTLSFGNVAVGSKSALTGTVTATGAPVAISSAGTNSNEFVVSGITMPGTVAAGQSAPFTVTFTPSATGTATASLTFQSNAAPAAVTQSLTGSGTAATQHSVQLTWVASTNVIGYNVYRSSTSGGPYTILNPSLIGTIAYTDTTVSAGTTYYYVVTAVDSSSKESGYSNETKAVIPTP